MIFTIVFSCHMGRMDRHRPDGLTIPGSARYVPCARHTVPGPVARPTGRYGTTWLLSRSAMPCLTRSCLTRLVPGRTVHLDTTRCDRVKWRPHTGPHVELRKSSFNNLNYQTGWLFRYVWAKFDEMAAKISKITLSYIPSAKPLSKIDLGVNCSGFY